MVTFPSCSLIKHTVLVPCYYSCAHILLYVPYEIEKCLLLNTKLSVYNNLNVMTLRLHHEVTNICFSFLTSEAYAADHDTVFFCSQI